MPNPAASEGNFWCIACSGYHRAQSIVTRHESGQAASGIVASAIVRGRLDASDVSEGRQRKRPRQDGGPPQEFSEDVPLAQDGGNSMEPGLDVHEAPGYDRRQAEDPYAVPAAVLSTAATAWTRNGSVWIEDAPDESNPVNPETGQPNADEEEEEVDPRFYEEEDDDQDELEAWVQGMEDALRRQMEDVGT